MNQTTINNRGFNRIGIFGGTFDPIHSAHIYFANNFIELFSLDCLYILPAYLSPFKVEEERNTTPPEKRLEMIRLAFKDNKRIRISKYELNKGGISYSYQTVKYFLNRFPSSEILMLIGSDQAENFKKWKKWEFILENTQLVIAERKLKVGSVNRLQIEKELATNNKNPLWVNPYKHNLSSTDVRRLRREGKNIKNLVPKAVYDYIVNEELYIK